MGLVITGFIVSIFNPPGGGVESNLLHWFPPRLTLINRHGEEEEE